MNIVTFDSCFDDFPSHDCHRLLVQILGWKTENNNFKNQEIKAIFMIQINSNRRPKSMKLMLRKFGSFGESTNHTLKRDP